MSGYPTWWTLRPGTATSLQANCIRTTRDLIRMANGMTEDDGEVVFIELPALHTFCNKHLRGLTLHLKTAYTEEGVRVLGTRPNTVLYHHPCFELPSGSATPAVDSTPLASTPLTSKSYELNTPVARKSYEPVLTPNENHTMQEPYDEIPLEYLCPIRIEVFKDPVVLEDGYTYERDALEDWLRTHTTSPMTGAPLQNKNVFPNHILRQLILHKIAA